MTPTTLRGGTYRTPPEIWLNLPDDGTRRDEYLKRYLARWRRMNPRYSAVKNREWRARNPI